MAWAKNTGWFALYWVLLLIAGTFVTGLLISINEVVGSILTLLLPFACIYGAVQLVKRRNAKLRNEAKEEKQRLQNELDEANQRARDFDATLRAAVGNHQPALKRNLFRAVEKNDYGAVIADKRLEAISEFADSVGIHSASVSKEEMMDIVLDELDYLEALERADNFDSSSIPVDGLEFEKWVANALRGCNWDAEPTQGSSDQGIDVLARKNGMQVGIQCKLYSSAVGNKAVQEAVAGKAYYGLDKVAVLTNAGFTKSAKDLAHMNDVILMSHHDIPTLESMVA